MGSTKSPFASADCCEPSKLGDDSEINALQSWQLVVPSVTHFIDDGAIIYVYSRKRTFKNMCICVCVDNTLHRLL